MARFSRIGLVALQFALCNSVIISSSQAQRAQAPSSGVSAARKQKPAVAQAAVPVTQAVPVTRYGVVLGDFGPFFDDKGPAAVEVTVLNQDLEVIGQVTKCTLNMDKLEIIYTQTDAKAVPAFVLVGTKIPGNALYPFTQMKAPGSDSSLVLFRQVIIGDFCLEDKTGAGGQ